MTFARQHQNGAWRWTREFLAWEAMKEPMPDMASKADSLLSWLREHENEMAKLLAELVSIPTENPPGKNYGACADLLEKELRRHGLDCERGLRARCRAES